MVVPSERRGAKIWNDSGSGESRPAGLLTSSFPRLKLEGEPIVLGVPERLDGGSGYTTPAGIGASSYRLGLPLPRCGMGRISSWRMGSGLS